MQERGVLMLNFIIGIVVILLGARFFLYVLGVTLSIVWNLLLIAICVVGIAYAVKLITDMRK